MALVNRLVQGFNLPTNQAIQKVTQYHSILASQIHPIQAYQIHPTQVFQLHLHQQTMHDLCL